jgi:hypothetical protein
MNEWNIQSRGHQCGACGEKFEDKANYHTVLIDQKKEFARQDICAQCWKKDFEENAPAQKGFISCWKGVYEAPPPAPPEAIRKENAESTLRRLIELNQASFASAAYILAVMLERKRLLKIKEQLHRDGKRIFIYEQPKSGDLFTVTDPDLQLNQLEEVQHTVADLLEFGLNEQGEIQYPPPSAEDSQTEESSETSEAREEETAAVETEDAPSPDSSPSAQEPQEPQPAVEATEEKSPTP